MNRPPYCPKRHFEDCMSPKCDCAGLVAANYLGETPAEPGMIVCSICDTPTVCCVHQKCGRGGGGTPGFIEPPPRPRNFDPVAVRGATHGDFARSSLVIQLLRSTWRAAPMWEQMTPAQQTAFDEMALKQVRILYGDPKFKDHWDDVVGYGKLGGRDCV